jgi:hypothetical protein
VAARARGGGLASNKLRQKFHPEFALETFLVPKTRHFDCKCALLAQNAKTGQKLRTKIEHLNELCHFHAFALL